MEFIFSQTVVEICNNIKQKMKTLKFQKITGSKIYIWQMEQFKLVKELQKISYSKLQPVK